MTRAIEVTYGPSDYNPFSEGEGPEYEYEIEVAEADIIGFFKSRKSEIIPKENRYPPYREGYNEEGIELFLRYFIKEHDAFDSIMDVLEEDDGFMEYLKESYLGEFQDYLADIGHE